MLVRISFEMYVPSGAKLDTVHRAANQALITMEDMVERETEPSGAPAGSGRIMIKFNNFKRTMPK